jgi:hypothetical protein
MGRVLSPVQQAEHNPDGGRGLPDGGGDAKAEQRDQGEVEHGTGGSAQHRGVGQGQIGVAVRRRVALAWQDQPPGQQRRGRRECRPRARGG